MTTIAATCRDCEVAVELAPQPGDNHRRLELRKQNARCPSCSAADEAARDADEAADRRERALAARHAALRGSGIPAARQHLALDRLEADAGRQAAINDARRWATGEIKGLVLVGPYGVGKTQIAASAVMARIAHLIPLDGDHPRNTTAAVCWYRAGDLVADLTRDFNSDQRHRAQQAIESRAPLVLDDLDKTRPSEFAAEQLFRAIDSCESEGRQLLVTTNLTPAQLVGTWPGRYGHAIASRLVGHCAIRVLKGVDRRLAA